MITRLNFLKLVGMLGAGTSLKLYDSDIVSAIENAGKKGVKLVWIKGQGESGCTESLLQGDHNEIYDAIMKLNVDIGSDDEATDIEPDILVLEGPVHDSEFTTIGEKSVKSIVSELAARTKVAVVAVGTCATSGEGDNAWTGVVGADHLSDISIPFLNLPGCPVHPDHVLLSLSAIILGAIPELDDRGVPKIFFKTGINRVCHQSHCITGIRAPGNAAIQPLLTV